MQEGFYDSRQPSTTTVNSDLYFSGTVSDTDTATSAAAFSSSPPTTSSIEPSCIPSSPRENA